MAIVVDLLSKAEHGPSSPVWLFTTSHDIASKVATLMPKVAADMPNEEVVMTAWQDFGEIVLCNNREEVVTISDQYAPEHLQVIARDLQWCQKRYD